MKHSEEVAQLYWESHMNEWKSLITKVYSDGFESGFKRSLEINLNGIKFYDLGLPSGTLWSSPVTVNHDFSYVTYDLQCYDTVRDLDIPSLADFQELLDNCSVLAYSQIVSKDVVIIGPNGNRINIGTKDYMNNPNNPCSTVCRRQGENTEKSTNMFWLKSEIVDNNAEVGVVDFDDCTIMHSNHFTGFKLPYLLVRKTRI